MERLSPDKKKLMVLGGLVLALVVVMVVRIMPSSGGIAQAAATPLQGSIVDRDPQHLACVAKIALARMGKEYTGDDARDPFEPLVRLTSRRSSPEPDVAQEPVQPETIALPYMTLYGIIWDPETPIAMIDGMDVRVGDRIKGARVTDIGIDRIILEYRSKRFELTVD